mgnify:CR=1 FL=1
MPFSSNFYSQPLIYGFAFGSVRRLLYRLKEINCCYLLFGERSIEKYLEFLIHDQPHYILGLDLYSGIDQDKIRIETICTNKFRNKFVFGDKLIIKPIPTFLHQNEFMKKKEGIGNSYCNLVSWKITTLIDQGKLRAKYTFLHIPKKLYHSVVCQQIDYALCLFKKTLVRQKSDKIY